MANYHREVYQPSFEDGPTYDLQDEEIEDARARLPLLIVIALLVMASFGGVVWLAYNQGLERALVSSPTVIEAPDIPVRTLPSEDGSDQAFTGLRIYNDPIPPEEEAEGSALAQAPSAPEETPQPEQPPAPMETAEVQPPAPVPAPADPPAAAPVQAPAPAPTPEPAAPAPTPAPAPAAQTASAVSGGAVLQVGAYPSEALAIEAWDNFQAQHAVIAAGLFPDIQRADLGERGIWYRVRIGPYTDDSAASAACETLVASGGSCFVAAP